MQKKPLTILIGTLAFTLVGGGAVAAIATTFAGPSGDGSAITPVGQRVTPAGRQTTLGDLPMNSALSPDGKKLLVTNNG